MVTEVSTGGVGREPTVDTHGLVEPRTRRERRRGFDRRSRHEKQCAGLSVETLPRQTMDLRAGSDRRKGVDRRWGPAGAGT